MKSFEKRIKAVIIDDEPHCVANLKHYITICCPDIDVIATGNTEKELYHVFDKENFDIAFLDVEIFNNNIFDLLAGIERIGCEIIFVTAYERYAVKAFRVDALDYILKPLLKADIQDCYLRIKKRLCEKSEMNSEANITADKATDTKKIVVKQGENLFIINQEDVYYLKARGVYTQLLFDQNGKQTVLTLTKPIGLLEKEYNSQFFYRIHKSYLLNVNKVAEVLKTAVVRVKVQNDTIIPIAKRRVNDFLSFLNKAS